MGRGFMVLRGCSVWHDWKRFQARCRNNAVPLRIEAERIQRDRSTGADISGGIGIKRG